MDFLSSLDTHTLVIIIGGVIVSQFAYMIIKSVLALMLAKRGAAELELKLQESEERIRQILREMEANRRELRDSIKRVEEMSRTGSDGRST